MNTQAAVRRRVVAVGGWGTARRGFSGGILVASSTSPLLVSRLSAVHGKQAARSELSGAFEQDLCIHLTLLTSHEHSSLAAIIDLKNEECRATLEGAHEFRRVLNYNAKTLVIVCIQLVQCCNHRKCSRRNLHGYVCRLQIPIQLHSKVR